MKKASNEQPKIRKAFLVQFKIFVERLGLDLRSDVFHLAAGQQGLERDLRTKAKAVLRQSGCLDKDAVKHLKAVR